MKQRTIYKTFASLSEANKFQTGLLNKYDSVRLVKAPFFESGIYAWIVA